MSAWIWFCSALLAFFSCIAVCLVALLYALEAMECAVVEAGEDSLD